VRLLDASLFAPYPGTLALGEYMPGYAPLAVPVIALTGNPVLAHNLLLVLSYALAALGAAALVFSLTGALGPAVVAGAAFAYAPRLLDQAYNVQTLAVFWVPWLLLALERFLARPTWPGAALVAGLWVALALSCLNLFVYATVLGALFLAAAVTVGGRQLPGAHLVRLAAAGVVAGAVVVTYLAPNRVLAREWGLGRALAEVERHSATLSHLIGVPREPLLRRLAGLPDPSGHEGLVPGLVVSVLAVAGLLAVFRDRGGLRPKLAPYVALTAAAVILALGPTAATPWGPWPLPYRALYLAVPGFDAIRTPARFVVFLDLGVAVLAGVGAAWWLARTAPATRPWLAGGLTAVALLESVAVPFPGAVPRLAPGSVPAVYRWLGQQDQRTLALGIPMGDWVNVAAAAFHLRPTVNGWSSYWPPRYPELVEAMERFPDERSLALVQGLGVDLVLVDGAWLNPARAAALAGFPAVLRPERAFPTHLVYRIARAGPAARPALEEVEATARVMPPGDGRSWQGCVTLRNAGPHFVPLYPLHRLHLRAEGAAVATVRWLPLDLAPGAVHTACLPLTGRPGRFQVQGEVEDGVRRHRFALGTEDAVGRLEPAGGRP